MLLTLCVPLALATSSPAPATSVAVDVLALKVDAVVQADGSIGPGGYVTVKDGRILTVGAASAPEGAWVVEYPGCTLCPGFVDPLSALGAAGDLIETSSPFTPELRAADALQPHAEAYREAALDGLTTIGLAPANRNLVSGSISVLSLGERASLLADGPLRLSLSPSALQPDRKPTSRMAAVQMLRPVVAAGLPGRGALVVDVSSPDEIRLALELLSNTGRPLALTGADGADKLADQLSKTGTSVVLGPFQLDTAPLALRLAGELSARGVRVVLQGGSDAASLRLTAALAVREGMAVEKALAAVTSAPAALLGVADQVGAVAAGRRADLQVYHGHPLDLGSRLEAVYAGGELLRDDS